MILVFNPTMLPDTFLLKEYEDIHEAIKLLENRDITLATEYDPEDISFFKNKLIFLGTRLLQLEGELNLRNIVFKKQEFKLPNTAYDNPILYQPSQKDLEVCEKYINKKIDGTEVYYCGKLIKYFREVKDEK